MDWTPFQRFIFTLGTITLIVCIAAIASGMGWLILRKVDKVLLRRTKHRKPVDYTPLVNKDVDRTKIREVPYRYNNKGKLY